MWLIIFIAALVRTGFLFTPKSLWGDELWSVVLAQKGLIEGLRYAILHDVHPPLQYALSILAHTWAPHNELGLRLLSLGTNLVFIYLTYRIALRLTGRRDAALFAGILGAVSPFMVHLALEIRPWGFTAMISSFSFLLFLNYLTNPGRPAGLAWTLAVVLSIYTDHIAWVWLLPMLTSFLWVFGTPAQGLKKLGALLKGTWPVWLLILPMAYTFLHQAHSSEHMFEPRRMSGYLDITVLIKKYLGFFWHLLAGYRYSMIPWARVVEVAQSDPAFALNALFVLAGVTLILFGMILYSRVKKAEMFWIGAVILLPAVLVALLYPIRFNARYFSYSLPFFFTFLSLGVVSISWVWPRRLAAAFVIAMMLAGTHHAYRLTTDPLHREDYLGPLDQIAQSSLPGDCIAFNPRVVAIHEPKLSRRLSIPVLEDPVKLSREEVEPFRRVWVVLLANMHPEITGRLISDYTDKHMEALGFLRSTAPQQFGGTDGLVYLIRYEKKR